MRKIKVGLQLNFPIFMSNIVSILLFRGEEKLACYLTAFYKISPDIKLFEKAVIRGQYEWLKYCWAFK